METFKVQVELPRDLLLALNISTEEAERKTREWVAFELFREGQISAGKSAEILGITKGQFISLLAQRGIPYLDLTAEELKHDLDTAVGAVQPYKD
ncbi:MAG: UPF0175 family protein [Anaerolineae bacterium]